MPKAPGDVRSPRRWRDRLANLAFLVCSCVSGFAAELRIGQVTVTPGATVSVPVTFGGASGALAAQFDVNFNPSLVSLTGISGGNSLVEHIVDQEELSPGHWRVLVYSTTNAPIASGTVASLSFTVPVNISDGVVPLGMTNAIVARVEGRRVQPLAQVDGALFISPGERFTSVTLASDGQLHMQFQGAEGMQSVFETSTNLTDWIEWSTNTVVGGVISFNATNTLAYPQRFYRARLLP